MPLYKAEVGVGPCGKGIYAMEPIEEGEVVWEANPNEELMLMNREEIVSWPDEREQKMLRMYSSMVGEDSYATTLDPKEDESCFFNHSCEPNVGFRDDDHIVALRPIIPGEHIAYDYAFTESEMSFHVGMTCLCGSDECRGALNGREWRSRKFAMANRKHVTSHIARRMDSLNYVHPGIYRAKSKTAGNGVFASENIKKGEVLGVFTGKVVTMDQLREYEPESLHYSLQVDDNLWQVPAPNPPGSEITEYFNHCCRANAGMLDSTIIVAINDINAWEEVNLDYGTLNNGLSWLPCDNFTCECKSPYCRGEVTSQDWQLPTVQERYYPHFPPFVRKLVDAQRALRNDPLKGGAGPVPVLTSKALDAVHLS